MMRSMQILAIAEAEEEILGAGKFHCDEVQRRGEIGHRKPHVDVPAAARHEHARGMGAHIDAENQT